MPQPIRPAAVSFVTASLMAFALSGCLARTALDIVTLPVKAAGAGIDAVTTSQAEADQKRGRELRRREQRLGELDRAWRQASARCANGNQRACGEAARLRSEIAGSAARSPREGRN